MSVLTPVIDSYDGEARRLYLKQGVETFHWIEDVYREYINERATVENFQKWAPLMKASGNNPKGGGKFTPRYVTLLEGTRIIPFDENILIEATGEAITDNADVDPDPFDTSTRTNPLKIYITPPAAELVKATEELAAIKRMAFDGVVTINTDRGVPGATWPTGTHPQPSNNLADTKLILAEEGLNVVHSEIDLEIDNGGDYRGIVFIGASKTKTVFTITPAAQVDDCEFYDGHVRGTLDGDTTLKDCLVDNINYVAGYIELCVLAPGLIQLGGGAAAHFLNCWSGVPGEDTPTIDMGGSGQALAMRHYTGGIRITNKTGPEKVSIDLASGQVRLASTVINGTMVFRGVGKLVDDVTGERIYSGTYGDLTIVNELLDIPLIVQAVWQAIIEGNYTAEDIMKIQTAVLAGKVSGAGTGTETFTGLDDISDRVVSIVDGNGNRTQVDLDVS